MARLSTAVLATFNVLMVSMATIGGLIQACVVRNDQGSAMY